MADVTTAPKAGDPIARFKDMGDGTFAMVVYTGESATIDGTVGLEAGVAHIGDVAISDGTTTTRKASVLDLTNSKPLATALVDGQGNQLSFPASIVIAVTPTVDTSAYAAGDSLHTADMTFANAAASSGGGGTITKLVVRDKSVQAAAGELWLFSATLASTTHTLNTAWNLNDSDIAKCVGFIPFGPYLASSNNCVSVNSSVRLPYTCAATSLFGVAVTRGTPTYAASDLEFEITCVRD